MRVSGTCFESLPRPVLSGSGAQGMTAQQTALADEGEVVVAAGGVGYSGATIGRDTQVGQVRDGSAVDRDRAARGVADADGVASIAAAIDVGDRDGAAVGRRCRNPAVAGGDDVAGAGIATTKEPPWRSRRRDWADTPATPTRPAAAPAAAAFTRRFTYSLPPLRVAETAMCRIHSLCAEFDGHFPGRDRGNRPIGHAPDLDYQRTRSPIRADLQRRRPISRRALAAPCRATNLVGNVCAR